MKRFALFALLLLAAPGWADPPPAAPAAPSVASIKARREKIAALQKEYAAKLDALVKEDAAEVVALNRELATLGVIGKVEPLSIGIGKPGKDGHSPVVKFGTGADADRLAIDGIVSGPHLTGPKGDPGSGPVVPPDAFQALLQAAYTAEPAADKAIQVAWLADFFTSASVPGTPIWANTNTADLLKVLLAVRHAKIPDTSLTKVRAVVDAELVKLFTLSSIPLDDVLKATAQAKFKIIGTALGGIVK